MKYFVLFALFAAASGQGLLGSILKPLGSILKPVLQPVLKPLDPVLKPLNPVLGSVDNLVKSLTDEIDNTFEDFKNLFDKSYEMVEDLTRRSIFHDNLLKILEHNLLGLTSYTLGVNKYTDLTPDEISKQLFGFKGENNFTSTGTTYTPSKNLQSSSGTVDWRKKGLVTPVKDQGQCGACYAFSATGALEGQVKKKTGYLIPLSEQNIVDCSQSQGNDGCDGGWMNQAFKYIKSNGGLNTGDYYPYTEAQGNCTYDKDGSWATVSSYVNIPAGDEKALMKAVASVGPISAAINAGGDFSAYESGIYDPADCPNTINDLTHAILIVGYGTDSGKDYWLVKNSWSDTWGLQGYFKLARNKNNMCGIATKASYPVV